MKRILVTGGLGYIGSHTVVELLRNGYEVDIIDNHSNSSIEAMQWIIDAAGKRPRCMYVDLRYREDVESYFVRFRPDCIIHFAALKSVEESVEKPLEYYNNNVVGLINLLSVIQSKKYPIKRFVFSSSCTVYDPAAKMPVTEESKLAIIPASPYGATKRMCESILADWAESTGTPVDILRYFNPAGADETGKIGEVQEKKRNLFPSIMAAVSAGEPVKIFGNDYGTPDGTCVRDYIHVTDLALGHIAAMRSERLESENYAQVYNLGTGKGTSVLEIVQACEKVMGQKVDYTIAPRRSGDIPAIWADTKRTEKRLGWKAERTVEDMVETAWAWETHYQSYEHETLPERADS